MAKRKRKSVLKIALEKAVGLLVFLIIIAIANVIVSVYNTPVNRQIIGFVNANLGFLITMSIIFAIGEIMGAFIFPLNLPAPLFNASGSLLLVIFFLRIFELLEKMLDKRIMPFAEYSTVIHLIVFISVFVGGYILIFTRLVAGKKKKYRKKTTPK